MAQAVDITPVGRAVEAAMLDLVGRIREEANERGKVASGKTLASLRTSVQSAPGFVVGTLTWATVEAPVVCLPSSLSGHGYRARD
jgi:hypothetical protein